LEKRNDLDPKRPLLPQPQKRLSSEKEKSEEEESCRARTRSYEKDLKQEALAKADSQIDSQALRDPNLAKVVTAWPALPPALKAAVLAIMASANT
jgi:hypothetical protein